MIQPASAQTPAQRVTLFEGARLIVGDGSAPIERSAFIVQGNRITAVGRAGEIQVPAAAVRVDLAGKTVPKDIKIPVKLITKANADEFLRSL